MQFYRVKFPSDTLWARTDGGSRREVEESLIHQVTQTIKNSLEVVDVDPETREVLGEVDEEAG